MQRSSFLTGSATANSNAGTRRAQADRQRPGINPGRQFARSNDASLQGSSSSDVPLHRSFDSEAEYSYNERDRQARDLAAALPVGPKDVVATDDDPHWLKMEPNTGTALIKRYMPHVDLAGHLQNRTLVPISTLYSICLRYKSDDGDATVPVSGDWLIMATLVERKKLLEFPEYKLDHQNRRINEDKFADAWKEYETRQRERGEPLDVRDEDNPWSQVRKVVPRSFQRTYIMVDMGQPLQNGQVAGDAILELSVSRAEEMRIEAGGKRVYSGGNDGAFEVLDKVGLGSVVCLLNPKVTKGPWPRNVYGSTGDEDGLADRKAPSSSSQGNTKDKGGKSNMIWLQPRKKQNIMIIGLARDVGFCNEVTRNGVACGSFVDRRTKMTKCDYHLGRKVQQSRSQRQALANGTSMMGMRRFDPTGKSPYSFSDGMAMPGAKTYVSRHKATDLSQERHKPESAGFRIHDNLGRERQAREVRARAKEDERSMASEMQKNRHKRMAEVEAGRSSAAPSPLQRSGQSVLASSKGQAALQQTWNTDRGMSVILDAKKQLEQKRSGGVGATLTKKAGRDGRAVPPTDLTSAPDRSWKALLDTRGTDRFTSSQGIAGNKRGACNPLSQLTNKKRLADMPISSKLLARHSSTASDMPRPILSTARVKANPAVRPPQGQSFFPEDYSDDELEAAMASGALDRAGNGMATIELDSDDDLIAA